MLQAFGLQQLGGSVVAWSQDREVLEQLRERDILMQIGTEIIDLEVNDAPLTEKGKAIQEEIRREWKERGLCNIHFDKQPGWFRLSADERAQMVLDLITIDRDGESCAPLDFDDRTEEISTS